MDDIIKKRCRECKETLDVKLFNKSTLSKDGFACKCNSCIEKIKIEEEHEKETA